MDLDFRIAVFYLLLIFAGIMVSWRRTRRAAHVAGGQTSRLAEAARRAAATLFLVPPLVYVFAGEWLEFSALGMPVPLRWLAVVPAVAAVVQLIWACLYTAGGNTFSTTTFLGDGPYRWMRHPQFAAQAVFFVALGVMCDNLLVIGAAAAGALLLRVLVAPQIDRRLLAEHGRDYEWQLRSTGSFFLKMGKIKAARYSVPRRFGLSAVLALTTVLSLVFGALNFMRAPAVVYFFVSSEIAAVCLMQIIFGSTPRGASALTGAVLLPFWVVIAIQSRLTIFPTWVLWLGMLSLIAFGALLGYCVGALAAGFFLVMDLIDPYLPGGKSKGGPGPASAAPKTPD